MTEAEWLDGSDLQGMFEVLNVPGCERKLLLFPCACCRRVPGSLESEPDRLGLELTERDADGQASDEDFARLPNDIFDMRWRRRDAWSAAGRAIGLHRNHAFGLYQNEAWDSPAHFGTPEELQRTSQRVDADLAQLVREIFGNPFRPKLFDPSWVARNGGVVGMMAQAIYDDRTFDRLPQLADALEDAGCTDADILAHCRAPGPHVRGCWVVDLLLRKE